MPNRKTFRPRQALIATALMLAWGPVSAVPVYYSFQGEVVYSTVPTHALGQSVRYVFLVDQDRDGYTRDGDGTIRPRADFTETADWFTLSFYAAYVGGDALATDNPASPIKESCFCGVDQMHYADDIFSALRGSNADPGGFDLLDIYSSEARFNEWGIGQIFRSENFTANGEGEPNSGYSSTLTLASITDANPLLPAVPEPSTLALFGIGLAGLAWASRKRLARGIQGKVPGNTAL
ncbi:MAG: hypothetical protein JWP91_2624 [Fibrobacteres bacterium]|nr:hypothetical protein [Fibrobacterota bacterium]